MIKKLLLAAVAVSAIAATPAMAADTVALCGISGSVGEVCSASATGSIAFGALTDGTGTLNVTSKDAAADTGAYCNGAGTTITIAHTNLVHSTGAGTAPAGFTKTVTFVPEVDAGATTKTGDIGPVALGAFSGLTVRAKSLATSASAKPLAGSYSGSITVTLTPGV